MSIKNSSNVKLSSLFHVKRDDSGKRPEAPTGKCDIVMIGDRSGSMAQMGSGPVEGLIDFVQTQFNNVKAGSSIHMELVTFNEEQTIVFSKQLKQENKDIFGQIRRNMRPRGFTMLYDTVVDALKRQEERLQKTKMTKLEKSLDTKFLKSLYLLQMAKTIHLRAIHNKMSKNKFNNINKKVVMHILLLLSKMQSALEPVLVSKEIAVCKCLQVTNIRLKRSKLLHKLLKM